MKRIFTLLIAAFLIASLAFPVSAATQSEDGIQVEMVTDKKEYDQGEKIVATLTVTNTNDYDLINVSLEGVVPAGYKMGRGSNATIPVLAAGETKTITVSFVRSMDFLWIILIVVLILLVIAAAVVLGIFLLRRKPKQITAAVLCVAMLLGMVSTTVSAADNDMALPDDNFTSQGSGETTPPEETTEETTAPTEEEVTPSDINISDDFSTFAPSVGAVPKENGWGVSSTAGATQTEDGKLKVTQLTFHVPEGITGDYAVEFRYQLPTDIRAKVVLGQGIQTTKSQIYLQFTGGGSKYEDRVNFNKGNVTSNVNYIFNGIEQWHLVQIAVSQTNKTYKMYVDGRQVNFGADTEFAFFNEQITKMTQVVFQCTGGHLQLDDFRIYMGEPEVDEGPVIENPSNYSDNFSNFQAMVSKNAPLKSYWWLTSESNAVQTEGGKVKVKELNYYVPQGISDSYTMEFKYQLPWEGRAYLKVGEGVETTKLQVYMTLSGGDSKYADRIKFQDGKEGVNEIFTTTAQWHSMKLIVDNTRKIYLAYVDGNLVTDEYDFYVSDISQLKRITWQCSAGNLLIDDFKIKPGAEKVVFYDYTPVANSDLIYEATFDNWALGEIKGREYRRWKAISKPDNGYTTSIMDVEGNRVLRMDQAEKGSYPTSSYTFKEPMTTSFTLEVRLKQHPSAAGQISLQPASGGYGKAGPDLRFSESGTNWYTLNGYRFAASDKAEDGWNIISVYVNMDLHTYDVYCNGFLMEEAIPFRNRETSELTQVIIGHCTKDQPGTTDIDYIRIYKGLKIIESTAEKPSLDGFEQLDAQIVAPRNPIPSNYSDVNLSTRYIRSDGSGGHEGSLDILKQFMVTYDRWVYSSSSDVTHRVTDLGVNMQQSVSPTSFFVSGVDTNAKWYDGTGFYFAWIKGSNHGCLNNPYALEERLNVLKTAVEDGSRSIQCDDPMYNWEFYKTGGCWCKYCVEKFTEYLLETYTAEELKEIAPNASITSSFNYRNFLEKTYGWKTNDDYSTNRHLDPLEPYYEEFQKITTINYHTFVKEYLNSLGYGEIRYSANMKTASMELSTTDEKKNAHYAIFTDSMPETNIGIMTRDTLNLAGTIDDALDRQTIFGVIPADGAGNLQKLRMAAVISYAMGTQAMIPWDTYVTSSHREWSSVEEVGDLYHFVRQYPYLFDDYKVPAIVGIAMDPTNGEQKTAVNTLSKAGITVKALPYMTAGKYANYTFTAEDVEGLKYVLEMASLPQDLKQLVTDSGAETVQMYPILGDQDNLRITWVENGNDDLYNTVRSYNGDFGAATSIHVVNGTNGIAHNTVVGINRQYLPKGNYSAVLYRPCYDPVVLDQTSTGRSISVAAFDNIKIGGKKVKLTVKVNGTLDSCVFYTVDEMNEWSILHIVPEGATEGVGAFDITDGWSSISLGTGLAEGDVITNNGDNSFTMTTKYLGDNVRTESDRTGSQDMMPFVYKNVTASKLMDYAIEAKVSAFGNSGVMIREYPSSNARQVSLYLENGKLMAAARITDNKTMFYREIMDVTQDMYLKIAKTSASFEFYASVDGQNWGEKLISVDMLLDKPLAGVFSFSGDGQSVANTVSEVKLTELGIHENEEISDIVIPVEEKYFSEEYSDKLVISATTASGMTLFENDFDTIEYKSSDESIMYVTDNRQIYGVSGGEATLTVVGTIGNYTVTGSANISVSSDGFVYLDENFDVWTPDTLGEGWSIQESAGAKNNTYIFSANHPSETDNSMGISDFSTFNATAFYNFGSDPIKRNHTIEFDYYLETELEGSEISNLNTLYISSPLGYMTCLFYERGYFKFYDNTLWHNICELAPNQWVHIQIDIDFQEQTNLFTITDSEGNVYQETYGLRNAGTSVTSLRFTTNTSAQGLIAYYDNLKVYVKAKTE